MPNVTIRNVPEELLNKLRLLAAREKRSLNNEILLTLEKGVAKGVTFSNSGKPGISKDTQISIWKNLCGRWEDSRKTDEIIRDIMDSRTEGRQVEL
jgi:hypothetical protein